MMPSVHRTSDFRVRTPAVAPTPVRRTTFGMLCRMRRMFRHTQWQNFDECKKMDLMHMIGETSLMMGFTFIVGMAFAYVLKLMTFFFSRLNGTEISALLRKGRIWGRAYRMDIARTDRYIRSVARIGGDVSADPDADHAMDALAEYHLGTPGDAARQDSEMTRLYELHHGTV